MKESPSKMKGHDHELGGSPYKRAEIDYQMKEWHIEMKKSDNQVK